MDNRENVVEKPLHHNRMLINQNANYQYPQCKILNLKVWNQYRPRAAKRICVSWGSRLKVIADAKINLSTCPRHNSRTWRCVFLSRIRVKSRPNILLIKYIFCRNKCPKFIFHMHIYTCIEKPVCWNRTCISSIKYVFNVFVIREALRNISVIEH